MRGMYTKLVNIHDRKKESSSPSQLVLERLRGKHLYSCVAPCDWHGLQT